MHRDAQVSKLLLDKLAGYRVKFFHFMCDSLNCVLGDPIIPFRRALAMFVQPMLGSSQDRRAHKKDLGGPDNFVTKTKTLCLVLIIMNA